MKWKLLALAMLACSNLFAADEFKIPSGEDSPKASFKQLANDDGYDWGVKALNVPALHAKGIKGEGVKVAVLDTGIDANHPDLKANVKGGKDYTNSAFGWSDRNSHGTHCAGTICAKGDLRGIAPDCEVYALKVLADNGRGNMAWCVAAIMDAVDVFKVDVISMSLGANGFDEPTRKAIAYAVSKGVIVVAAAGNDGPGANTVGIPGGYAETICVGASDATNKLADFSSRGTKLGNPFIVAPGVDITSTILGGKYGAYDGTSMATPHVAGCMVLWCQVHGKKFAADKRVEEAKKALVAAASFKTSDSVRGHGMFDAVKLVGETAPKPDPAPTPGVRFTLTESDLLPEARKKLNGATFSLILVVPGSTTATATTTRDYASARKAVERGENVILAVGESTGGVGEYRTNSLPGIAPGRYRCYLDGGVPMMVPIAMPVYSLVFQPAVGCVGGRCYSR